ncbi:MAG: hypothetical protein GC162_02980 [Planctomycetes bacterium]|nr:hypothetical protein [Planctomycetota bacterium]
MKRLMIAMFAVLLALSAGCSTNFPYGTSWDRHNFVSTPNMPLSLSLVDTVTGQTVWTLDIPVNQQAVVDLEHNQDWVAAQSPATPAHEVRWKVMSLGTLADNVDNHQKLNGNPVLLKVMIRDKTGAPTTPTAAATAP